jgi:phosphate transport system substrate-binding protein
VNPTIRNSIAAAVVALAASAGAAQAQSLIQIDGSSTVYPITEAMAEEFQKANPGIRVTVGISGTGGGFKRLCAGEIDIADASRPITAAEVTTCKANGVQFIELPIALDALAVVVNPRNNWVDSLTVDELKAMWQPEAQGKITNWRQVRASFPDRPLKLFGAGVDSGTYDYFTLAIVGKEHSSRGDFTASEDDNVLVQGVSGDMNALGFFGLAYLQENRDKVKPVPIKANPNAPAVAPTVDNAKNASYQPLSRPIFIYVNRKSADKPDVAKFVSFYMNPKNATELVSEVGYVPLPESALTTLAERFTRREIGTGFTGSQVGVSVDVLLREKLVY